MNNLYDDPNYSKKRDELTALLYARMKLSVTFVIQQNRIGDIQ